ncbi:MAG: response regulator transcription factor [Spirochaetaceae bacterium]|nr:response regulator transcription factor [Spirochaetaceae bacterium]
MDKTFYIIDDHEMLRFGTVSYIEKNSDWKSIGSSGDHDKTLSDLTAFAAATNLPSLVICDLIFCGEDTGFSLIKKIHTLYPEIKIMVYSMLFAPGVVQNTIEYGASGYISKNASSSEMLLCMDKILHGEVYIQKELQQSLAQYVSFTNAFTRREKQVMNLLMRHYSNDRIADVMNLKKRAVENYLSSIYKKTGINDKAELIKRFGI